MITTSDPGQPAAPYLAQRIRARRLALGLTIGAVASRSDVSAAYISRLERGERTRPSQRVLRALAFGLDTTVKSLTGNGGEQ